MSCETEPPPHIRYDDIWPTCEGATPMLEVAIRQRLINIDLVLLHHQLAQVLFLMASLEVKGVHAFSLFDQRVVSLKPFFLLCITKVFLTIFVSSFREDLHFLKSCILILLTMCGSRCVR